MSLSFADLLGQLPTTESMSDESEEPEIDKRPVASSSAAAGESADTMLCRKLSRTTIMRGLTFLLLGVVLLMSGVALGLTAAAILGGASNDTTVVQAGLVRRAPNDITLAPNAAVLAAKDAAAMLVRGDPGSQGDDGTALRNPLEALNQAQAAHLDDGNVQPDGQGRDQLPAGKRLGRRGDGPAGGARLPQGSQQRQRHGNGAAADAGRRGSRGRGGRGGKQQQQE